MDGTRGLGRALTADATGKGELFQEVAQTEFVISLFGINLGGRPLEIRGVQDAERTVFGASRNIPVPGA